MKSNWLYRLFLIASITISLTACKKNLPACRGNCGSVHIVGMVMDKALNQPMSNVQIKISLYQKRPCIICSSYNVGEIRSQGNGRFDSNFDFDTSLLKNYYLNVAIAAGSQYISYPEPVGPGLSPFNSNLNSIRFYTLDTAAMNNISFDFYTKTLLHINLHRTSPIISQQPNFDFEASFSETGSGWGLLESESNKDTTLTIYTAVRLFTKIKSYKYTSPTNVIVVSDSIKCAATGNNSIDIDY